MNTVIDLLIVAFIKAGDCIFTDFGNNAEVITGIPQNAEMVKVTVFPLIE